MLGNSPEILCDLIPPSVGETNNYNLRNSHNICQTTNILTIFSTLYRMLINVSLVYKTDILLCLKQLALLLV
jgi:hypothetical protein